MKTRADLLDLLRVYEPHDQAEREMVRRTIEFIEAHHDCCERSLEVGHLTGSAWIVDESRSHVLMTHHRKLNRWLQLGGHADGDFDLLAVALREANEESGVTGFRVLSAKPFDVDVHLIPARGEESAHYHYDVCFELESARDAPLTVSEESHRLEWIPVHQVAERYDSDESIRRKARKILRTDAAERPADMESA